MSGSANPTLQQAEYKLLTQKDGYFRGKFKVDQLEGAINRYASQGWTVVSMTTASLPSHFGGSGDRDEIIVLFSRPVERAQ